MDPVPDQLAQPMVPQDQPAQQDLLPAAADALDQALAGEAAAAGYESSDLELSSDDDDDSSASEDNGDEKQDVRDMDLDMEGESQVVATRNEITDIVVEMPVFDVTESTPVVAIGRVESILDKTVVIQSDSGVQVLDMGCLLVYADRTIIGEVFETFGPISHPYYSVRYNSKDDIDTTRAISGAQVFYVPSYERSQLVEVEKIRHIKGTDASNLYDEEINESVSH
ncbi:Gar1/Naf1 RNA binding region-domain-containing protein [Gongronella butleri]|nr:Gar1/Naf1 RNA binding region-domain-containing protein [Gongronella butleri]